MKKKLSLNKETLAILTDEQTRMVGGGATAKCGSAPCQTDGCTGNGKTCLCNSATCGVTDVSCVTNACTFDACTTGVNCVTF